LSAYEVGRTVGMAEPLPVENGLEAATGSSLIVAVSVTVVAGVPAWVNRRLVALWNQWH
jgi:hypothetical protein